MTPARRGALIFILAVAAFYLYGLGNFPLVGPDEPRYAQVAREMYGRGDFVTPTLGGHTWFEKPALLYWMMAGSYGVFGVGEFAARFGSAISGLLTVLLIFWLNRRVHRLEGNNRNGEQDGSLWSSVALASSAGMIVFSRAASFDVVVTMTITSALASFIAAEIETDKRRQRWLLVAFYVAVGASLLAKGLVGLVIPAGVIGLYYLLRREWPRRAVFLSVLWGIPLAVLIAAAWYGPVILRHGWTFVDEFFIQHHFARFVSNQYHHPQRFYFYLPIIVMLAVPWTPFLISALTGVRAWSWQGPTPASRLRVFAFAWLVAPIVFFSVSQSKLPGYILPALPGAMLLAGRSIRRYLAGDSEIWSMRATGIVLVLLGAGGIAYAAQNEQLTVIRAALVVSPLIITGILTLVWKSRKSLTVELIAVSMFVCVALVLNFAAPQVERRESVRDLIYAANVRGYSSTPVFYMLTDDRTGEFYAGGRLGYRPDGEPYRFDGADEVANAARQKGGSALVFVPTKWEWQLVEYSVIETEIIGRNGELTLAAIRIR